MDNERKGSGPFVMNDKGQRGDRDFWETEMNPEAESKFDRYLKIKQLGRAAKKELSKRNLNNAFESIMESFK